MANELETRSKIKKALSENGTGSMKRLKLTVKGKIMHT